MIERPWEGAGLGEEEYRLIVDFLGRQPNGVELGIFGVMWSEHCSYKNSKPLLAMFPTSGERVLQGPGENAGVVDIGDGWAIALKIESHNHPSAIEPYQGAATGVGGIVRDILAMGARPVALLDSLRFGDPADPGVEQLLKGVVAGIAGYGNAIGVPTVGGEVGFEKAYKGNPLVNVMCVGLARKGELAKGIAAGIGNPVMILGARTGRDGIHGATFASEELAEDGRDRRPAVQVGDPFMEKLLIEACLELLSTGAIVGIQDLGAAGLTSASCEMASRGQVGMELDVTLVPRREEGMTPYEVMLSESQERMLVIVKKGREDEVSSLLDKWDLNHAVIGRVIPQGELVVKEGDRVAARVPIEAVVDDAPVYTREGRKPGYLREMAGTHPGDLPEPEDYNQVLLELLGSPNIATKEWIYRQYDYMVQTNTLVLPGSDGAVLRIKGTGKAIALTTDGNGRHCFLDPYQGGRGAVAEAARNLVCAGAEPIALTDCLNFGNPEKPEIYWQMEQAITGMAEACRVLGIPVVGGNVSLYNEKDGRAIYPTPVVGMVGLLENWEDHLTQGFKSPGDIIVLLGDTTAHLGGSEYLAVICGREEGPLPPVDLDKEKRVQDLCLAAARAGLLRSAHDCAEGGLLVTVAESCLTGEPGPLGARIRVKPVPSLVCSLFAETPGRIVVSLEPEALTSLEELAVREDVPIQFLGEVIPEGLEVAQQKGGRDLINLPVAELWRKWRGKNAG